MKDNIVLTDYLSTFIQEMVRSGINHVVISPGSRSTPLALLFAEHPVIKTWVNIDERSAAFFALGIAKSTRKPVAILCTSGTAAANYFPAIVEATYSRIPLVVLTADRPHELRDVGAPQAINQLDLFGQYSKWFVEMALPENSMSMLKYVQTVAARAVSTSEASPAGVVHLNFPFREPLVPNFDHLNWNIIEKRKNVVTASSSTMDSTIYELFQHIKQYERGIIVCGPHDEEGFSEAVNELAKQLGFPILADPLSQLRSGQAEVEERYVIDTYDTILKSNKAFSELMPDVIIRFGAMPVSKVLTQFISQSNPEYHVLIDKDEGYRDPTQEATHFIHMNEVAFCEAGSNCLVSERKSNDYVTEWRLINTLVKPIMQSALNSSMFEGDVIRYLLPNIEDGTGLFVGNSMPIRDLDSFFFVTSKNIRIFANRGANGIDGVISTALGASVNMKRLILVVGDLTFFHDLNGLLMSKLYSLPITIIIINNNGGGIFSFLPQSKEEKHFELLFGTPIHLDYEKVVSMYDGNFKRIQSWDEYQLELKKSFQSQKLHVIEVPTDDRTNNVALHRKLWDKAIEKVDEYFERPSSK